jgi:predicted negative regulator of RcsB-dependent stress response
VEEYLSEKEKWEWLKDQVRQNAPSVLLAIALAAAVVLGWRWWQQHLDGARFDAGARYMQMVQTLQRGDRAGAFTLLTQLEKDYPASPYTDQARLLGARVYVDGGELDKAAGELTTVVGHSADKDLAQIARLRLARVQIAQGKPDSALATVTGLGAGAFAARYHEVRGDAYYAKGDKAAALTEYRAAQTPDQSADEALLQLKIADLAGAAAPATATAANPSTAPAAASK